MKEPDREQVRAVILIARSLFREQKISQAAYEGIVAYLTPLLSVR